MNQSSNHRSVAVAAIAAGALLLVLNLTYHTVAARLGYSRTANPIAPETLERLPMQISGWTGRDVPLDPMIVRKTGTDGRVNRHYSRDVGGKGVGLYVAYGVTARALAPHRPEVCYVKAGWTLTDRQSMELPLKDGEKLPCNMFRFSRGGLNTEKMVVLNYFIVDGRYCGDASLLQSRAWRGSDTVDYVAQIQISSPENPGIDSAAEPITAFTVDSAEAIAEIFKPVSEDPSANSSSMKKEMERL